MTVWTTPFSPSSAYRDGGTGVAAGEERCGVDRHDALGGSVAVQAGFRAVERGADDWLERRRLDKGKVDRLVPGIVIDGSGRGEIEVFGERKRQFQAGSRRRGDVEEAEGQDEREVEDERNQPGGCASESARVASQRRACETRRRLVDSWLRRWAKLCSGLGGAAAKRLARPRSPTPWIVTDRSATSKSAARTTGELQSNRPAATAGLPNLDPCDGQQKEPPHHSPVGRL